MGAVATSNSYYLNGPEREYFETADRKLKDRLLVTELVSSSEVRKQVVELMTTCRTIYGKARDMMHVANVKPGEAHQLAGFVCANITVATADLTSQMRHEFGVDSPLMWDFDLAQQRLW